MGILSVLKKMFKAKKVREDIDNDMKLSKNQELSAELRENVSYIKRILKGSSDIVYRDFEIGQPKIPVTLIYVEGMVEKAILNEQVLKPLMIEINKFYTGKDFWTDEIKKRIITASEVKDGYTYDELILALLSGEAIMLVDGLSQALIIGSKGWESRSPDEPPSEQNVRGPRDGFVENIRTNIVSIRRRIKDPNLAIDTTKLGRRTKTDVAVVYLKGVINEDIVSEVSKRLKTIDIDGIIESGQVEQIIQDRKWTPFPQVIATERPDKVVAAILGGRAVILVDNTPFALVVPVTISMFMNSVDDYYDRTVITSTIRATRYISFFISSSLPAAYLALVSFHPGMIPARLALSITATRMGLPFPAFIETLLMEFVLEVLQEAGVRLPKPVGQTVSIVGGLVIGQAAVQAGLVSPILVIIVALTAVSSFSIPSYTFGLTSRILRVPLIAAASLWGFYGLIMAWIFLLIHLASIRSFGVGYLEDFSPYKLHDLKDTVVTLPPGYFTKRPKFLKTQDRIKQRTSDKRWDKIER